jgi:hypothetical protein
MDYSEYSKNELENLVKKRDKKINKQAKILLENRSGLFEKTDNELINEIVILRSLTGELNKELSVNKDEIEELMFEISDLLLLISK